MGVCSRTARVDGQMQAERKSPKVIVERTDNNSMSRIRKEEEIPLLSQKYAKKKVSEGDFSFAS